MKSLIKKILKESIQKKVFNSLINLINNGTIKPPYFNNLTEDYSIDYEDIKLILGDFFGGTVNGKTITNKNGEILYYENYPNWLLKKYDKMGNLLYYEDSDGIWIRSKRDENGNEIYWENSLGVYEEMEYDERGNLIYKYNSEKGVLIDRR